MLVSSFYLLYNKWNIDKYSCWKIKTLVTSAAYHGSHSFSFISILGELSLLCLISMILNAEYGAELILLVNLQIMIQYLIQLFDYVFSYVHIVLNRSCVLWFLPRSFNAIFNRSDVDEIVFHYH